jgi:uncharacterized protein (DUF305 family)
MALPVPTELRHNKWVSAAVALLVGLIMGAAGSLHWLNTAQTNTPAELADYRLQPGLPPSPVDIGFVQSMHLHHAQAVQMAMLVRHIAPSADIRALADMIFTGQSAEMGLMKGWLSAWGAPLLQTGPPMDWVEQAQPFKTADDALYASRCRKDAGQMAGMASAEQILELSRASGAVQEKLFLELMRAHHQSALEMAAFARRNARTDLVKGFATALIKEQRTEIGWIEHRLAP